MAWPRPSESCLSLRFLLPSVCPPPMSEGPAASPLPPLGLCRRWHRTPRGTSQGLVLSRYNLHSPLIPRPALLPSLTPQVPCSLLPFLQLSSCLPLGLCCVHTPPPAMASGEFLSRETGNQTVLGGNAARLITGRSWRCHRFEPGRSTRVSLGGWEPRGTSSWRRGPGVCEMRHRPEEWNHAEACFGCR